MRMRDVRELPVFDSWQFLYFLPLPQGHGSFRPVLAIGASSRAGRTVSQRTDAGKFPSAMLAYATRQSGCRRRAGRFGAR